MAMLGDGRRKADVASSSPMTIVAMFGTAFREMGSGYPALTTRIRATAEEPRRALTTRIHRSADP
jgi:CRP-like cAMP-binding protein